MDLINPKNLTEKEQETILKEVARKIGKDTGSFHNLTIELKGKTVNGSYNLNVFSIGSIVAEIKPVSKKPVAKKVTEKKPVVKKVTDSKKD